MTMDTIATNAGQVCVCVRACVRRAACGVRRAACGVRRAACGVRRAASGVHTHTHTHTHTHLASIPMSINDCSRHVSVTLSSHVNNYRCYSRTRAKPHVTSHDEARAKVSASVSTMLPASNIWRTRKRTSS